MIKLYIPIKKHLLKADQQPNGEYLVQEKGGRIVRVPKAEFELHYKELDVTDAELVDPTEVKNESVG